MGKIGAGVLLKDDIKEADIISEYAVEACYQTASYDLRIGDSWIPTDDGQQKGSSERLAGEKIVVPAFGSLIVSTHEVLKLPLNVVGKFNLRIKLALKGLFVQMGTQVEPGYHGRLFAVLNNITKDDIELSIDDPAERGGDVTRERVFTIEFFTTTDSAPEPTEPMKPIRKINSWVSSSAFARSSISAVVKDVSQNSQDIATIQNKLLEQQETILARLTDSFGGTLQSVKTEWEALKNVNDARESLFDEKATGLEKQYQAAVDDIKALDARLSADVQRVQDTKMQFIYTLGGAGIFLIFMSALVPFIFSYALDQSNSWWERGTVETYQREMQSLEGQLEALRAGSASTDVVDRLLGEVSDLQSAIVELEAKIDYLETRPGVEGSPSPGEN